MAERKAQNKYYPPDWKPERGTLNKPVGVTIIRERNKSLNPGRKVRFEMPFSIWCLGCNNHVGQGVRFNAKKLEIGMYYTTPIYNFKMKCLLCPNYFEIQTDPKNSKYQVTIGAKQKVETWEPHQNETIDLETDEQRHERRNNAFMQVEHRNNDLVKGREMHNVINSLRSINDKNWKDPYLKSQILRKKFREQKKEINKQIIIDNEIIKRNSLSIQLEPKSEADELKAKQIDFKKTKIENNKAEKAAQPILFKNNKYSGLENPRKDKQNSINKIKHKLGIDPFGPISLNSKPVNKQDIAEAKKNSQLLPEYSDSSTE